MVVEGYPHEIHMGGQADRGAAHLVPPLLVHTQQSLGENNKRWYTESKSHRKLKGSPSTCHQNGAQLWKGQPVGLAPHVRRRAQKRSCEDENEIGSKQKD